MTQLAADENPEWVIDENDRYSRLQLIDWWDQDKIRSARALVVGAGALGNEVLKNLVLLGWGQVFLVDFDHVQGSNLSRSVLFREEHTGQPKATVAAEMANQINPDCVVRPIVGDVLSDIGLGLVQDVDLVICCVDNREARLWINRLCWKTATPWIDGGIQEINGVAKVFLPPDGACYECAMTENDYRLISLRYSCPLLKQEDIQLGRVPTSPTIASIIAGLQVQEALKLIHQLPNAAGSALVFNGVANLFYKTKYQRRSDCLSHETYDSILTLPLSARSTTVQQLLSAVASERNQDVAELRLVLDRDFLVQKRCRGCQSSIDVGRPLGMVSSREGICPGCQQPYQLESICEVGFETGGSGQEQPLSFYGIPDYDIVKVVDSERSHCVLLSADAQFFPPVSGQ